MQHEAIIALGIGLMVYAAGFGALSIAFDWLPDPNFTSIDQGSAYATVRVEGRSNGHMHLWFETEDASMIKFLILDAGQYREYKSGHTVGNVGQTSGTTGNLELEVSEQSYYLVFQRLSTDSMSRIDVVYQVSVTGVMTHYAYPAAVMAILGASFIFLGAVQRWRAKA